MVWLTTEAIPRINIGESRVSENTLLVIIVEMPCINCLAIFDSHTFGFVARSIRCAVEAKDLPLASSSCRIPSIPQILGVS